MILGNNPEEQNNEKLISRYKDLEKMLFRVEESDDKYLTGELKKLRDRIFYAHIRAEANVDAIISKEIIHFQRVTPDALDIAMAILKIYKVIERSTFKDKILAARKINGIKKETFKKLDALNDLRNDFAHPKIHLLKTKYAANKERIAAIDTVINALLAVVKDYRNEWDFFPKEVLSELELGEMTQSNTLIKIIESRKPS